MLNLIGGLFSIFVGATPSPPPLQTTNWSPWMQPDWVLSLAAPSPDPIAELAVQQHLSALTRLGLPSRAQGVWMQTGDQVLVNHQGDTPLSAASLTKVATTLAALSTWGTEHQFETVFSTTAPVQAGVVQGDLIVQGGGDPFFVWEEAIAVGNALNQAGIQQVTGRLIVAGNFTMNFEDSAITSGELLKQGLNADLWSGEAETQYQQLALGTARPRIVIAGSVERGELPANAQPILRRQSMPMVDLVKAMNIYSNNIMAQMLADSVGGAAAVSQQVSELTQIPQAEIQLHNGSGLGTENRLSPRAVAAMLSAIQRYLQARNLTIADVFPVVGRDGGTLAGRRLPSGTVIKTGTLNEVSALAGVLPTRDRGLVWFAIINSGQGDLGTFHYQQDALLSAVDQTWGTADLVALQPHNRDSSNRLGISRRNQLQQALEQAF
ncbi:MAG: D-alanyl-D-alanine carboxypeptidase [Pegethrix bostrychoides GSE-TBD4-15B]|uniref:D-alanyl-D-alanine carboxypeptidase n=1 Tax=Pegethrix bostrychoides GSE-TBD4-15B TaxID=2839662 RepID=A0A951U755_9CYAN|nr:D-alanyl-D-alanine carboxypeptidase [Pegethrix bostrychoides GSE-TBD4-15B]